MKSGISATKDLTQGAKSFYTVEQGVASDDIGQKYSGDHATLEHTSIFLYRYTRESKGRQVIRAKKSFTSFKKCG